MKRVRHAGQPIRAVTRDKLVRKPTTVGRWGFRPLHDHGPLQAGERIELNDGFELLSGDRFGTVVKTMGRQKVKVKMFLTGKMITLPVEAVRREGDTLGEYSLV